MKKGNSKSLGCAVFICCATLLFCFSAQALGQEDGTSLMLEVTPAEGGSLNIVPGVHSYDRFAEVTLIATPKPGYQFVYWMGNVTDATTGTTTVFLNSPKMVIAIFERSQFETVEPEGDYMVGGEGSGGLVQSVGASDTSLEEAGGGQRTPKYHPQTTPESDVPVPVPEPVTVTLFFAGFLMLAKSRRNGANTTEKT
ncbi:MAG: hypothetical protein ABSG22_07650 [Sedimentisphaerales bacterium]